MLKSNSKTLVVKNRRGYTAETLEHGDERRTVVSVFLLHQVESALEIRQRHRKLLLTKVQPTQKCTVYVFVVAKQKWL